jgi:hypothetical protein
MIPVPIQRMRSVWLRLAGVAAALSIALCACAAPPKLTEARLTRQDGSSLRRLFPGERVVQLRTSVQDPGAASTVKAILTTVDVLGHKNRRLAEQQGKVPIPEKGNRTELIFSFSLPRDWPVGTYRIDVQLDSQAMVQRTFEVRSAE